MSFHGSEAWKWGGLGPAKRDGGGACKAASSTFSTSEAGSVQDMWEERNCVRESKFQDNFYEMTNKEIMGTQ